MIKIVLLFCFIISCVSCNERQSENTNRDSGFDSIIMNLNKNRTKLKKDSLYHVYKDFFSDKYWFVSAYRCGHDYISISKGLDTILFYFGSDGIFYLDNVKAGTWKLKDIMPNIDIMSLMLNVTITDSIKQKEIFIPSADYEFWKTADYCVVLRTRYGQSHDKVFSYQISLKMKDIKSENKNIERTQ